MEKIKLLREKTGAGMVDCKKALEEAGNDLEKAAEILRKKGIAKAAKRNDREAGEGIIKVAVSQDEKTGYIMEINAETDFVVRSDKFQAIAEQAINLARDNNLKDLSALLAAKLGQTTVKESLENLSGVIGEKLEIKKYESLTSAGQVACYSHLAGKIGVLVALDKSGQSDLAHEIAMQVAAGNPKYLGPDDVPAEELAKEKEIYRAQLMKENKPEAIMEKIIAGKLNKYYEEVCLNRQEYIKDDTKKVADLLAGTKIEKFIRYSL